MEMDRNIIEQAYAFFHQKLKVYEHSPSERERDHIEDVIARYADVMSASLFVKLSRGNQSFLHEHTTFRQDLNYAVETMAKWLQVCIRPARPEDADFLARCIMAGMHFYDFEEELSADNAAILENLTSCEKRPDTLYSFSRTRVAEIDGKAAGALLSYPGNLYKDLRESTFQEYWPGFFTQFADDDPETDPGEYYLDSLAVLPEYRGRGIGRALLKDGIRIGLDLGYKQIALVADADMPHLIRLYESAGFVPADRRHAFGIDFQRMIYSA